MTKFLKNADVTGYISQTSVTSSLIKTDANGKLVAAIAGTDYNAPGVTASAGTLVREIRNTTGATLTKGTIVYISGATGNKPTVSKALATGDSTSAQTFGMCQTDIPNNSNGNVVCFGDLSGLDTSAYTEGVQLYLSSTTAGEYTSTKQLAPAHLVYIGVVTRAHPTLGQIEVRIQNGYELDEIHDVAISSLANNQGLFYESSTDLWKNKSISTVLGYTPADDSTVVKLTGTQTIAGVKTFSDNLRLDGDFYIKQDSSFSPISGYNSITGDTGGYYLRLGTATAHAYLYIGDLTNYRSFTFPDASGTIALTSQLSSYVPTSRTLTINGTAFDLSANRSWTIAPSASARTEQIFTATSGQTTFTVTGGYVVGLVDVYVNGVKLLPSDFTASNGTTVVLADGAVLNDSVTIINYTATIAALPTSRDTIDYTATSAQTTFTVSGGYVVGLLDVYVNGVKLTSSEYTATNGTTFVLSNASVTGDQVQAIRYNASITGVSGSGTANYVPKFTASQTIGNSLIQDDGTTVTIGSTNSSLLMTRAANTNEALVNFASGGTTRWNVGLRNTSTDDFSIFNPVLGIPYMTLSATTSLANFGVAVRASTFTSYTGSGIFLVNSSGGTNAVQMRINNTGGDFRAGMESSTGGTIQSGTSAYAAVFGNQANYATQFTTNGTVRMTIAADGNVSLTGALSGTSATFSGDLTLNNGLADGGQLVLASSGFSNWNIDNFSGRFRAYYGSTEYFTINSSGNVLINTTSATGAINVDSNRANLVLGAVTSSKISFNNNSTTERGYIYNDATETSIGFPSVFNIQRVGVGNLFTITSSGNVGIGTTTISTNSLIRELVIGQGITNGVSKLSFRSESNSLTSDISLSSYLGENIMAISTTSNIPMLFVTNSTERMRITSGGNVGIGTSSPRNNGAGQTAMQITGADYPIFSINGTNNGIGGVFGIGSVTSYIGTYSSHGFSFVTSDTERMRITSGGNVLIGTTSDGGYKLDVSGKTRVNSSDGFFIQSGSQYRQMYFDGFSTLYFWNGSNQANLSSAGAWVNASDATIKKDITAIKYGLSDLMLLNPCSYKMKTDDLEQIGFIAQEVEQIIPEVVNSDNKGMKGLSYGNMVALLTKSIQELKAELDTANTRLQLLENN